MKMFIALYIAFTICRIVMLKGYGHSTWFFWFSMFIGWWMIGYPFYKIIRKALKSKED